MSDSWAHTFPAQPLGDPRSPNLSCQTIAHPSHQDTYLDFLRSPDLLPRSREAGGRRGDQSPPPRPTAVGHMYIDDIPGSLNREGCLRVPHLTSTHHPPPTLRLPAKSALCSAPSPESNVPDATSPTGTRTHRRRTSFEFHSAETKTDAPTAPCPTHALRTRAPARTSS